MGGEGAWGSPQALRLRPFGTCAAEVGGIGQPVQPCYFLTMRSVLTSRTSGRKRHQPWFLHPEMRARIARAEEDFAQGRSTRTETPEEAQAFLDRLKKDSRARS